jgi:hypothetical protein
MLSILAIQNYLPDTAKNERHTRAKAMRELVEGIVATQGDEIVSFTVVKGTAYIQTKKDETLQHIQAAFGSIPGVAISKQNAIEADRMKNEAAQEKAAAMRARRRSK